jgi:acetylglutamate kinase
MGRTSGIKIITESIMKKSPLYIIKAGGHLIDDEQQLRLLLENFATLPAQNEEGLPIRKILIHGGGKLATRMAEQLGIQQELIEGRRVTDAETLKIVTMVYAGYINKNIVATLQALHCNAIGLCGADGNLISAHKRVHPTIDYGWVGDVDKVNSQLLETLLESTVIPVIAPITHDQEAHLLNTNADTIAQTIAVSMSTRYEVKLVYTFEKEGVLLDVQNEASVISSITREQFNALKTEQKIVAGMIPKLENAFTALEHGVNTVIIGKAEKLAKLLEGQAGTTLTNA